jgi:DNA-binding CsgD family transcriptional regulator
MKIAGGARRQRRDGKTHVALLLAKLDLRDRTHAVLYAYEHGVVEAGRS